MRFEEKLSKLRKQNALSQEELAEKLNVSRQTISKWELGQTMPDSGKIQELASLFNVSVDELLNETTDLNQIPNKTSGKSENKTMNTIIIIILVIGLVSAIAYIGFWIFIGNTAKNIVGSTANSIVGNNQEGLNIARGVIGQAQNMLQNREGTVEQAQNIIGQAQDVIDNSRNEVQKNREEFNIEYNQTLQTMQDMQEKQEEYRKEEKSRQEELQKQFEENQKRVLEGF